MTLMNDALIERAREYVKDKYLDLADVPLFIERLVLVHDALVEKTRERKSKEFDVSDV
jgi:hypothetical protein